MSESIMEKLAVGELHYLFFQDNSSAKRDRMTIIVVVDGNLYAMTSKEYQVAFDAAVKHDNSLLEDLRLGKDMTYKPSSRSKTYHTGLCIQLDDEHEVLSVTESTRNRMLDRGKQLRPYVEKCLRLNDDPNLLAYCLMVYSDNTPEDDSIYVRHLPAGDDEWIKLCWPTSNITEIIDNNINALDDLPKDMTVLERSSDKQPTWIDRILGWFGI